MKRWDDTTLYCMCIYLLLGTWKLIELIIALLSWCKQLLCHFI